jgi:hypothetical protein
VKRVAVLGAGTIGGTWVACSATIRMVVGDNQDGYLRHRLVTSMAVPIAGCKGREVDCRLSLCSDNQASGWLFG